MTSFRISPFFPPNLISGVGRYSTGDGLICEGEWLAGRQDGFAVFVWPDGHSYLGDWKEGKQHGNGIYESPAIIHEGTWVNGKREGIG